MDHAPSNGERIAELAGHFRYLDKLRESGRTNMWDAPRFLMAARAMDEDEAKITFGFWQDTFDGESEPLERAERAILS